MWAAPALLYFAVIFQRSTLAVIADRLMADFAVGASALGLLAGLQLLISLGMQLPCGTLADLLGPRRLLTAGACLAALGTVVFAAAPSFGVALAGRCLYSLGDALVFLNVLRLQAEWFRPREYATLVGLTGFSGGLGGIAATAPLALLVHAYGWRAPVAATGLAFVAVAALVWIVVRDRPESAGLPSWSALEPARPAPGAGVGSAAPPGREQARARWRLLRENLRIVGRNPQTYYALLSHFALFGPFLVFTTAWGVAFVMQAYGLDRPAAGRIVALAALGGLVGGPLVGWLSDRLGRRRLLILGCQASMLVVWGAFMLPVTLPRAVLDLLVFWVGFGASGNFLAFAAAKEANPPESSGLATGFTNLGGFSGGAILPPLFGAVLDARWAGAMSEGARVYPASAFGLAFGLLLAATLIGMAGTTRLREQPASPGITGPGRRA